MTQVRAATMMQVQDTRLSEIADTWAGAACRDVDPNLFFASDSPNGRGAESAEDRIARIDQAISICRSCPLIRACDEEATTERQMWGVWGGVDREAPRRPRPRARPSAPVTPRASVSRRGGAWTPEDDQIVRDTPSNHAAAAILGRTVAAVARRRSKALTVNVRPRHRWTPEDDEIIMSSRRTADAAARLRVSRAAVKNRRTRLRAASAS
jgi:hypothetical protein